VPLVPLDARAIDVAVHSAITRVDFKKRFGWHRSSACVTVAPDRGLSLPDPKSAEMGNAWLVISGLQ
jgi:hypothetical protein